MANTTLRNGSTGSDVKKLQQTLIEAGYNVGSTGADGVYGKNTAAAVKQYQKDNGLAVDGIAGKNTLGSLYAAPATTTVTNKNNNAKVAGGSDPDVTPSGKPVLKSNKVGEGTAKSDPDVAATSVAPASTGFSYADFSYGSYTPSDTVNQANALLEQQKANKPGAYQSQWQGQIDEAFDAYTNRDPFSYDFNADALYQQYRDNYIQQGQMAMMDTMGQAAAMTGGYGNSYAQSVGQQVYNQQLNQLNDIIPELYQMALDRYDKEGTNLYNQYNMLLARENKDYERYQNDLNNYYNELEYLTNRYDTERNLDYSQWETGRQQAYNDYNTGRQEAYSDYITEQEREYQEIRRGEGAQRKRCRDPRCSPRGNPACRGTFGGRRKAYPAISIFSDVISELYKNVEKSEFEESNEIIELEICIDSGLLANKSCARDERGTRVVKAYYKKGTEPKEHCKNHYASYIDTKNGEKARLFTPFFRLKRVYRYKVSDNE